MRLIREEKNLTGKTVLLRVDFNVESDRDSLKLRESLPTIELLRERGAKIVLMSHRGRPTGFEPHLSLRFALPFLTKSLGTSVHFLSCFTGSDKRVQNWDFDAMWQQVTHADAGSVFLLENVRFHPGEDSEDRKFGQSLASLGDIYVNDAFASWRPGTSVTVLPHLLPAYAGLLIEKEVEHLDTVLRKPKKPLVVIMGGGGKAIDKFEVIKNLYPKATTFLIGGVLGNTFLKAAGKDIGNSIVEESLLDEVKPYLHDSKFIVPTDWVMSKEKQILDLGPQSSEAFARVIKKAGTIIWNGPLGLFEDKRYRAGSRAIAEAIAASHAFSVAGGGETTEFILQSKLEKEFSFLSTGGGAMLAYLAGKKLPALAALAEADSKK